MAVTAVGSTFKMTAANDSLNAATVGHGTGTGTYRCRVNAIAVTSTTTTGAYIIKANGSSGTIIMQDATGPAIGGTSMLTFSKPQELDDITVTTLAAGLTVLVHLA